ncbi:MAG TPA: hypothetical protein VG777_03310 [Thermoanaerobaculia bacterium]|nr:hypothetical protein [Thermoanaerobaculia bacterium]
MIRGGAALLAAAWTIGAAAAGAGGGRSSAVGADARALGERAARLPAEDRQRVSGLVGDVERELGAGRDWSALERLREARRFAAAVEFAADSRRTFESAWEEAAGRVRKETPSAGWQDAPAAARALGEAAGGTAVPLLDASRAYAKVTDESSGRYYLGQAVEAAAFARFCRSLPAAGKPAPPWRSIAPELAKLQERVDAAFVPPRSIERHPDFIRLNASLKTARELDGSGLFAGAAYEYLSAVEQLGRLEETGAAAGGARDALAAERRALASSGRDESLALVFVERAEAEPGTAPVVVSSVLPAYREIREPAAPAAAAAPALTVTLVRWPYT